MPLITSKTNLKSLKYGNDRPGNGSSGQPYIQFAIPENATQEELNYYQNNRNSLDFPGVGAGFDLSQGGAYASQAAKYDQLRISKFFKDKSRGPLFIMKQEALQLSNPKIQTGDSISFGSDLSSIGILENTRIYNGGLNTLAQVGVQGTGFHFDRHGTVPINPFQAKYEYVASETLSNNPRRLVILYESKILGLDSRTTTNADTKSMTRLGISKNPNLILQYAGGPTSIGGIGLTTIHRRVITGDVPELKGTGGASFYAAGVAVDANETRGFRGSIVSGVEKGKLEDVYEVNIRTQPVSGTLVFSRLYHTEGLSTLAPDGAQGNYFSIPRYVNTDLKQTLVQPILAGNNAPFALNYDDIRSSADLNHNKAGLKGRFITPILESGSLESIYNANVVTPSINPNLITVPRSGSSYQIPKSTNKNIVPRLTTGVTSTLGASEYPYFNIAGNTLTAAYNPNSYKYTMAPGSYYIRKKEQDTHPDQRRLVTILNDNILDPTADQTKLLLKVSGSNVPADLARPLESNTKPLIPSPFALTYNQLNSTAPGSGPNKNSDIKADFRLKLNQKEVLGTIGYDGAANIATKYGIGNPGQNLITTLPSGSKYKRAVSYNTDLGLEDRINAADIVRSNIAGSNIHDDLIKFRFDTIEYDSPGVGLKSAEGSSGLIFRAYLTGIQDNHAADYQPFKYIGRGENFYTYNGASRTVQFSFKIAAQSRKEMKMLYRKLNYLVSQIYPDYAEFISDVALHTGFMRAPLIKLTIGDYIAFQPGFLNSMNISIPDESPWEIVADGGQGGKDKDMYELPHVLDVSCQFTPIHNFLPRRSWYSYAKGHEHITPFITPFEGKSAGNKFGIGRTSN